jgi:hypothetical protein
VEEKKSVGVYRVRIAGLDPLKKVPGRFLQLVSAFTKAIKMFSLRYHIQSNSDILKKHQSTHTTTCYDCVANKQNPTCHNIPLKAAECGWGWSS